MQLKKTIQEKEGIEKREYIAYLDQKIEVFTLVFQAFEVVWLKVMTKDLKIQSLEKHLQRRWGFFVAQARQRIIKRKK